MASLVFDAGPIISLAMNNLLWLLKPLKERFSGKFLITKDVKKELVDKPLQTRRFKFEAIQIVLQIQAGHLEVVFEKQIERLAKELEKIANGIFFAAGKPLAIFQSGELATLACALVKKSQAIVVDERITRLAIESPDSLRELLQERLKTSIEINEKNLELLKEKITIPFIRSSELVLIAYELGVLKDLVPKLKNAKEELLEGLLWGLKLSGCAISEIEINELLKKEFE